MVDLGRSLHQRGLAPGTSGNLSVRLPDGFLLTPTGASLGWLDPDRLSRLDTKGAPVAGDPPTKEWPLHLAVYIGAPTPGAWPTSTAPTRSPCPAWPTWTSATCCPRSPPTT